MNRRRESCPVEGCDPTVTYSNIHGHLRYVHATTFKALGVPRRRVDATPREPVAEGDTVVLGPEPKPPVRVTVTNGFVSRTMIVHLLPMADVFDAVVGGVRQAMPTLQPRAAR